MNRGKLFLFPPSQNLPYVSGDEPLNGLADTLIKRYLHLPHASGDEPRMLLADAVDAGSTPREWG